VPGLLRVFSFKSREEIEALEQDSREHPAARVGQRALAEEITTLVHGAEETRRVIAASQALFGQGELSEVDERTLEAAKAEIPSVTVFGTGEAAAVPLPSIADMLAELKIVPSKSDARRTIAGGGAYLNNEKVTDVDAIPTAGDLLHGRFLILRRGKRTVGAVEIVTTKRSSAE
jgi:tyrosyl-tRNA synthetase